MDEIKQLAELAGKFDHLNQEGAMWSIEQQREISRLLQAIEASVF